MGNYLNSYMPILLVPQDTRHFTSKPFEFFANNGGEYIV